MRLIVLTLALGLLMASCSASADAGASTVSAFFRHLEKHEFDAAADMVRDSTSSQMTDQTRRRYIAGWRKAYESYDIHFTNIVVRVIERAPNEALQRAGAREGYFYDVKFEGTSNSPCVPVSSSVLPLLTHPLAVLAPNGSWFLTTESMIGSVTTCPGT